MLHTVKKVKYLEGYKLKLVFDNGKTKIIDFEDRLRNAKNMFLPLKDVDYFKKVKTDGTTLVWPNGLDLCPDVLYEMGAEVNSTKSSRLKNKKSPLARRSRLQPPIRFISRARVFTRQFSLYTRDCSSQ
jgi:Protein of unknown function (DUF2442)